MLALLISAAALLILAGPLRIPYPIPLVLGGLLLGFGPGVPAVTMPPQLVLVGVLPPLLYVSAYFTGLRELPRNLKPISFLALGLVALTTAGEVTIAFLTGYFAFLPASALDVSGVLAVVTAGVYMGWYTPELTTVQTRLQGRAFWEILTFLLNVLLFGLVRLQLRPILDALSGIGTSSLLGYAAAVVLAVVLLTIVGVFAATYVPRWLIPRSSIAARAPWTYPACISWDGMRGAVTIAAALLIPLETDTGAPFPDRDLIVFLAFAVVLATLVVQGLSLPVVIRALRLDADDGGAEGEEATARIRAAEAALARLDELVGEAWVQDDTAVRLRGLYRFRIDRFSARIDPDGDAKLEKQSMKYQRLRRELLEESGMRSSSCGTPGRSATT